jgi:hypothetical protein
MANPFSLSVNASGYALHETVHRAKTAESDEARLTTSARSRKWRRCRMKYPSLADSRLDLIGLI